MEKLRFEIANEAQAQLIAHILTQATKYKIERSDSAWGNEAWTAEEVRGTMTEGPVYLIFRGAHAIGTFSLSWDDERTWGEQSPVAGYIHRLAVADKFRGQGLGKQAIEWAAAEVARNGRQFLRLDCPANNTNLCAYYEKLGFRRVDTDVPSNTKARYEKTI